MASPPIVLGTGVIFAVADSSDDDHDACDDLLSAFVGELVVPTPVVVESSWLIEDRLGPAAEARFLRSVTSGELHRQDLTDADWERATSLVENYADLGLGLVDASIVAIAERLGATAIATLSHRDFRVAEVDRRIAFARPQLPAKVLAALENADHAKAEADGATRRAAEAKAAAARALVKDAYLSMRDAAEVPGLSHQRVQQLLAS